MVGFQVMGVKWRRRFFERGMEEGGIGGERREERTHAAMKRRTNVGN